MTAADWHELYCDGFMLALTNEERRYFALNPIAQDAESVTFVRKEDTLHTRVTIFFEGDVIVKVINETLSGKGGVFWAREYEEYDTRLQTENRQVLLPLTPKGKAKKLTASSVNGVTPFGCTLRVRIHSTPKNSSEINLYNMRSRQRFPLGEWNAIRAIRSEAEFRTFLVGYIATCREDYFDKLQAFRNAQKTTVRYRPGDIFRMAYDRTRYCYGIITGDIRQLRAMDPLPRTHGFNRLMTVPIMVRLYDLVTGDPHLTARELAGRPLGQVIICSDNDIIWGTHPIVNHKALVPDDLYFKLNCTLETHYTGRFTRVGSSMTVEWGFASVTLTWDQISEKLKSQLDSFTFWTYGVTTGIDPCHAAEADSPDWTDHKGDLLTEKNRSLRADVFACLGLDADTTFDQFAERFGGLTRQEIIARMA